MKVNFWSNMGFMIFCNFFFNTFARDSINVQKHTKDFKQQIYIYCIETTIEIN